MWNRFRLWLNKNDYKILIVVISILGIYFLVWYFVILNIQF